VDTAGPANNYTNLTFLYGASSRG